MPKDGSAVSSTEKMKKKKKPKKTPNHPNRTKQKTNSFQRNRFHNMEHFRVSHKTTVTLEYVLELRKGHHGAEGGSDLLLKLVSKIRIRKR